MKSANRIGYYISSKDTNRTCTSAEMDDLSFFAPAWSDPAFSPSDVMLTALISLFNHRHGLICMIGKQETLPPVLLLIAASPGRCRWQRTRQWSGTAKEDDAPYALVEGTRFCSSRWSVSAAQNSNGKCLCFSGAARRTPADKSPSYLSSR